LALIRPPRYPLVPYDGVLAPRSCPYGISSLQHQARRFFHRHCDASIRSRDRCSETHRESFIDVEESSGAAAAHK
jgi:hypothetical protein